VCANICSSSRIFNEDARANEFEYRTEWFRILSDDDSTTRTQRQTIIFLFTASTSTTRKYVVKVTSVILVGRTFSLVRTWNQGCGFEEDYLSEALVLRILYTKSCPLRILYSDPFGRPDASEPARNSDECSVWRMASFSQPVIST
jgi:hypothetical protein